MICTPYDLYCSLNIVRLIISRRMKWAEHVARREMGGVHTLFCWGDLKVGDCLEDVRVNWMIILKWLLQKWDEAMDWIDVAQDRGRCGASVNAVMNRRVP